MNLMPIRLFTIQDGEGYVADVFQCPVTGNLIYKSSGTPAVVSYNNLTEQQKQELTKYGFKLFEQGSRRNNFISKDQSVEELLSDL